MNQNIIVITILIIIFVISFYITRKIESFKGNIEHYENSSTIDNLKQYVQEYLPPETSWESILNKASQNQQNQKNQLYNKCLSINGWIDDCVKGRIRRNKIKTPKQCNKRVKFNCESTNKCKWYFGYCENKNFEQQLEDPFSFRTRSWWDNRIAGYPNIIYDNNRDGFIQINKNKSKQSKKEKHNEFYNQVMLDLIQIISDKKSNPEEVKIAQKYLKDLNQQIRNHKYLSKRIMRIDNNHIFNDKKLCSKNYTRNCFINKKHNSFVDDLGSIWNKDTNGNYIIWEQQIGGANSTYNNGN